MAEVSKNGRGYLSALSVVVAFLGLAFGAGYTMVNDKVMAQSDLHKTDVSAIRVIMDDRYARSLEMMKEIRESLREIQTELKKR